MKILIWVLCLACSGVAHGAIPSLHERSPFLPGLWWNTERPGSGFDLQRVGDQAFLIWYTYRADGSPVWYTAQGVVQDGAMAATLLEHRWADAAHAGQVEVGTISMRVQHQEAIELAWSIGTAHSTWQLAPFRISGVQAEVDHSGAWYEAERPGYGLTLSEQGGFLFAVLYFYDDQGQPVWAVGDNAREGTGFALSRFEGSCPYCPYQAGSGSEVGSIALRPGNAFELELDATVEAPGWDWNLDAQSLQMLSTPALARPADRMMVRMGTEAALREHLHRGILEIHGQGWQREGGIDFSAPPPTTASASPISGTNLQEAGVDEMALLKSDGDWVFSIVRGDGWRAPGEIRAARLDTSTASLSGLHTVSVEIDESIEIAGGNGLVLTEDRLVAVHGRPHHFGTFGGMWFSPWAWTQGRFQVDILDRAGDPLPTPIWRGVIDGNLLGARRIGDQLLLIYRHTPDVEGLHFSGGDRDIEQANARLLAEKPLSELLPGIRINGGDAQALVGPDNVLLPPAADRNERPDFMLLTRIDLRDPSNIETLAILGYLDAFHVSTDAVYLASSRYRYLRDPLLGTYREGLSTTDLHRIVVTDGVLDYRASGAVEGFLDHNPDRASFRMGEHDGRLRVLSQSWEPIWGAFGRHRLSILEESTRTPGLLRTVSLLPNANRPQPIGKPDEMLYGTRFIGDRLYAVTFLAIDPLYVIDLGDPSDPFIAGEVELPGFSEYLHPLPDGLLLGFGQDAVEDTGWGGTPIAWFQGLKLSLFDVSDAAAPQVLQEVSLGRRGSESALLLHHHAFSFLPGDGERPPRFAIPMALHGDDMPAVPGAPPSFSYPWTYSGLFRFELSGSGSDTRIVELDPLITRSPASGQSESWDDGGRRDGRSLLFEGGSLYLDGDALWLGDWSTPVQTSGPH